jgi:energy-coupling factor transporter ATP-binding protein EcfA2
MLLSQLVLMQIGHLSGGQKSRLAFASQFPLDIWLRWASSLACSPRGSLIPLCSCSRRAVICWKEPHMLIMDEPTNHLEYVRMRL